MYLLKETAGNIYHKRFIGGAFDSAKKHKRQRRKRQSVTANEKSRKRQSSYRLG